MCTEHYRDTEWLTLQLQPFIPSTALAIAKNHCFNFIKTQIKPYAHCIAVLSLESMPHGDIKKPAEKLGCVCHIIFQCCKKHEQIFQLPSRL